MHGKPPLTSIYTYLSKWDQDITLMSHCKSKDQNKNKCGATFFFSNAFTATSLGKDYWQVIPLKSYYTCFEIWVFKVCDGDDLWKKCPQLRQCVPLLDCSVVFR